MSYTKPVIVAMGAALARVENHSKGDCNTDAMHEQATVNAYEADE